MRYGLTIGGRFRPFPGAISSILRLGVLFPMARMTRGTSLGVQAVVTKEAGDVLLVRQSYSAKWQFPGGGVDAGETIYEAVARELLEEAGVHCDDPPTLFSVYSNFTTFPGDHIALFRVENWSQPEVPAPNREILEQRFFSPTNLPSDVADSVGQRLREISNEVPVSHKWV